MKPSEVAKFVDEYSDIIDVLRNVGYDDVGVRLVDRALFLGNWFGILANETTDYDNREMFAVLFKVKSLIWTKQEIDRLSQ